MRAPRSPIDFVTIILAISAGTIAALAILSFLNPEVSLPEPVIIGNEQAFAAQSIHSFPSEEAPIQLIEWYTYGCGYCRILNGSLRLLQNTFKKETAMHYIPLHMGRFGFDYETAIAAHCVDKQEYFTALHTHLFSTDIGTMDWEETAEKIGIPNAALFVDGIDRREPKSVLHRNEQLADSLNLAGVPFIIINGRGYLGSLSFEQMEHIVERELSD